MINDTVREELETKISRSAELVAPKSGGPLPKTTVAEQPMKIEAPKPMPPPARPLGARFETGGLRTKKTSPTLVEFQTKKATVPEWRLQLQNSVRQKVGANRRDNATDAIATPQAARSTNGANALKVEFVEDEQTLAGHQNPKVASALKRIEESRRTFSNKPIIEQPLQTGKPSQARNFPFNVVAKSNEPPARPTGHKATVNPSPKPMLVSPLKIEKKGFDTNKLPPLKNPAAASRQLYPRGRTSECEERICDVG